MNTPPQRPFHDKTIVSITEHSTWSACRKAPKGTARPVVGPHTPLCGGPRISLPLTYTLKVIEPASRRVVSSTPLAGPEEAAAALRLLGPTTLQPVLVCEPAAQFFPRLC
jgi:hypothetical protein